MSLFGTTGSLFGGTYTNNPSLPPTIVSWEISNQYGTIQHFYNGEALGEHGALILASLDTSKVRFDRVTITHCDQGLPKGVDFSDFYVKVLEFGTCTIDLACERLPRKGLEVLQLNQCLLAGTFPHERRFGKLKRLLILGSTYIVPKRYPGEDLIILYRSAHFRRFFDDVIYTRAGIERALIPDSTKIIVNAIGYRPEEADTILDTHPQCQGIKIQIKDEEDASDVIRLYRKHTQLRQIQGSRQMLVSDRVFESSETEVWRQQIVTEMLKIPRGSQHMLGEFVVKGQLVRDVTPRILSYLGGIYQTTEEILSLNVEEWISQI